MKAIRYAVPLIAAAIIGSTAAQAQPAQPAGQVEAVPATNPPKEASSAPDSLVVLFEAGSSTLRPKDKAVLDKASRTFNEGKPIVMVLTGTSDRVGGAKSNLALSQRRATAVYTALLERGLPADRFQILAKGQTELPVPTKPGIAESRNRSVEISWR